MNKLTFFNQKYLGIFICALILLSHLPPLNAQSHPYQETSHRHDEYNAWAIRLAGGTGVFMGDIKQNPLLPSSTPKNEWRFGGSLGLEYRLSPVLSLKGQALFTQLAGTKTKNGNYFDATAIESTLSLGLYPVNLFSLNNGRIAEFYFFGGVGLVNFDAKLFDLTNDKLLASSGNGNGSGLAGKTLEPLLLAGFGIDFPINTHWMISFETSNKAIGNDRMDLVVSQFKYDVYNFTSLGITYRFGSKTAKRGQKQAKEPVKQDYAQSYLMPETPLTVDTVQPELPVEELPSFNKVISIPSDTLTSVEPTAEKPETIATPIESKPLKNENSGYRVQILASSRQYDLLKLSNKTRILPEDIEESQFNGLYIYVTGWFKNMEEAVVARDAIRKNHATPDAWIVYFENGQRQKTIPKSK